MPDTFFTDVNFICYPQVSLHVISDAETIVDVHGERIRRAIATCDIPTLLDISLDSPVAMIEPGTIAHSFQRSNSEEIILFHTPPQMRTIHLEQPQARSFDFFYKDMIFLVKRELEKRCFAREINVFTHDTKTDLLYVPPLYNLNRNGSMCFGSVEIEECRTIPQFLNSVVFDSIWTHVSYTHPKTVEKGSLLDYLYSHREKGWDFSDLCPYKTLREFIKKVQNV